LLRETQILPADASVVFVTSTGTPGSPPNVLAVRHISGDVGQAVDGTNGATEA
jgi:hypothetical protein